MKTTFKRILSGILAGAMALSLAACAPEEKTTDFTDYSGDGKVFTEPTQLDVVISNHVSWPYNEDWIVWKYIQEATGATLNITAIPNEGRETKLALMMTNQSELPDLLHVFEQSTVSKYATSGAFLSYTDNMDKMPNWQAFWNTIPEVEREGIFQQRTSGDGKIYSAPAYGTHTVNNLRAWLYRKDIFEKHGLEVPTTADELYQVAKKLKELYPNSYPICFRSGIFKLESWGPSWQNDFSFQEYYDFDEGVWKYGAAEPIAKEMVEYFLKLKNEGLVPPDYTDIETKSWEELMSTDRGFITLDYIVRLDSFNNAVRLENPDYTLAMMPPPKGGTADGSGQQKLMKANLNFYGYCVCNTGDKDKQDAAFKLVDWMYTDEAAELLGWGKEGETYEVNESGRKQFILGDGEDPQNKYGFGLYGAYQRIAVEANEALYTEEQVEACHQALPYLEEQANPLMWMGFGDDVGKEVSDLHMETFNYTREYMCKFLLGQLPMSEWDTFQAGLKDMGVDRLLELYTEGYNNIIGK